MPKAKKLPSGSWRCRVYDYTDDSRIKHYKSFTAPSKKEAEYAATQYSLNKKEAPNLAASMTLEKAVNSYIESKEHVLSPATIIGYRKIARNDMESIKHLYLSDFDKPRVQAWVNTLAKKHNSTKTVKNTYGLFSAVIDMFIEKRFKITFPQTKKPDIYVPSDVEIKELISHSNGDLQTAIYLAAFGGLRRGEICALTRFDVHDGYITVNKSMGLQPDRSWAVKLPKTTSSQRDVDLPEFLIKILKKKSGRLVSTTPDQITESFATLVKECELNHFRFHDLRHYYVSINHAIGIPDAYIMEQGGWSTDRTMKAVYRNTIKDEKKNLQSNQKRILKRCSKNFLNKYDTMYDTK